MECVFIYADGSIGLRSLPNDFRYSYKEPIRQPLCALLDEPDLTAPVFKYREYLRRGRMFNGRPIFSDGYAIKQIKASAIVPTLDAERADKENRRHVRTFAVKNAPGYIELDEHVGGVPDLYDQFKGQNLVIREARLLVAIK